MFLVKPKSFSPKDRLTWTIVANGQSMVIPLRLHTDYNVSPFGDVAVGNKPPQLRLEEQGAALQGPVATLDKAVPRTASVGKPIDLTAWVTDDAKSSMIERPDAEPATAGGVHLVELYAVRAT